MQSVSTIGPMTQRMKGMTMAMTRKDFEAIAKALREAEAGEEVVRAMAAYCATTNPRFDKQRFIEASTEVKA